MDFQARDKWGLFHESIKHEIQSGPDSFGWKYLILAPFAESKNQMSLTPLVVLPTNLLADSLDIDQAVSAPDDALVAQAQSWLDQVRLDPDLDLQLGEVTMFIPDMPNVPPQDLPVIIAQANQAADGGRLRTAGVCEPVPSRPENYSLENVFEPKGIAARYLRDFEHKWVANADPGTITLLQAPKHGVLHLLTEADGDKFGEGKLDPASPLYAYLPNGYLGKDKAVFLVEMAGVKVKVVYFLQAVGGVLGNTGREDYCQKTGAFWKISSTLNPNGNATLAAIDYQDIAADSGSTDLASTHLDAFVADASKIGMDQRGQCHFHF